MVAGGISVGEIGDGECDRFERVVGLVIRKEGVVNDGCATRGR